MLGSADFDPAITIEFNAAFMKVIVLGESLFKIKSMHQLTWHLSTRGHGRNSFGWNNAAVNVLLEFTCAFCQRRGRHARSIAEGSARQGGSSKDKDWGPAHDSGKGKEDKGKSKDARRSKMTG